MTDAHAREDDTPSRFDDCQKALEGKLQELMEEALRTGWSADEISVAFIEIGDRLLQALAKQRRIDFAAGNQA